MIGDNKEGTPFFLVWNQAGRPPAYKHSSLADAQKEAERLARQNSGKFYVLAAVGCAEMTTLETQEFPFDREAESARESDDIPF